jgi:hypothetical protein
MPANTNPIYSALGRADSIAANDSGNVAGVVANTVLNGSGFMQKAFTANTSNGSYVQKMRFRPVNSPAGTVARVFVSSNSTAVSSTATWLFDEITLPAVTLSQTAATSVFELPLNFAMPPNYALWVTFGTSTGTSGNGYSVVTIAGDY